MTTLFLLLAVDTVMAVIDPFTLSLIASGVTLGVQGIQQHVAGKRADAQALEARQQDERTLAANKFQSDSLFLKSYPTAGIEQSTFAKYGGWVSRLKKMGKGGMIKRADGSYSQRGLWDNIRANKGSGKEPTAEMLKQERKIKAESKALGGDAPKRGDVSSGFYNQAAYNPDTDTFKAQYSLPTVNVSAEDPRVKNAVRQGRSKFLTDTLDLMGEPQRRMVQGVTGKNQTPSEAWGFNQQGLPWYNPKNIADFAMDAVLDPTNLAGVGLVDDAFKLGLKNIPQKAGKALGTESGLLSNAWKLNPKAYQYNLPENAMYRGLGQEGMEDALSSGLFRSKQNVEGVYIPGTNFKVSKSFGVNPYFSPGFEVADRYGKGFIAEVPRDAANWRNRYKNKPWSQIADKPIPIEEGRILQKDWLKGYKEVPKQLPGSPNAASSVDDVGKGFGLKIDDLNSPDILKKSKDVSKNVDLGIGKFDHTNQVDYKNGLQLHTYSKSGSNIDDVILVFNPKTNENIAYMRNYKIGDDWKPTATNEWHIKADMPTADKDLIKFANNELEKIVQVKPTKFEGKTISTDGLRYWKQQQKHGYSPTSNTTTPLISAAGKDDLFKGLNYDKTDDAFEGLKFKTEKDASEGASRLTKFMKSQGLDYQAIIGKDNSLRVNLPKLQRAFSTGGVIGAGASFSKNEEEQTNFKEGGEKPIPVDQGKILQKDWLQGYKEIGGLKKGVPVKSLGGMSYPDYIAEGGEVVDFNQGNVPQAGNFGKLNRLSSNMTKINGDSHDAPSGGVEMAGGERVYTDRIIVPQGFTSKLRKL